MFKIGEFSKLSNVSIRMLRHYDKLDLLIPDQIDESTGFRYYSAHQLQKVNKIQKLKVLGFSLGIIKEMLEVDDVTNLSNYFEIRERELKEELAKISVQSKQLDRVKNVLEEDTNSMNYNVVLKEIPERNVMSIRKVVASYAEEGKLWEELYGEYQKQKIKFTNPPMGVTIYHDSEYKEQNIEIEVQSSIEGTYADTEEVKFFKAPKIQEIGRASCRERV